MTIINQELWDKAPESVRSSAGYFIQGSSIARALIYFPAGHEEFPDQYKITWLGPRTDATTVATNLDAWL